jgi:hypothetical protein
MRTLSTRKWASRREQERGLVPQRALMIHRQQLREGGRRLGHPIRLDKVTREHRHGAPQGGFRDRRRPVSHEAETTIAAGRNIRDPDQAGLNHGRHQDRPADLGVAERADDLTGHEILLQIQGATPRDGQEAREGASGVIERDDEETALPRPVAERER